MTLSHDRSDEELVDAFIEGDNKAFSTIVERHRTRLTTVARRYTRNDHDAQDVVQEAFLRASCNLHSYRRESALSTWLHRLVKNSGYDYLNHRSNRENASLDAEDFDDDRNPLLAHNPSETLRSSWWCEKPCSCCARISARRWCLPTSPGSASAKLPPPKG